jgi:predicted acyltransferase
MQNHYSQRLLSLDFLRGLIMILLILGSTDLYDHILAITAGSAIELIVLQFFHHPWHGLRLWDLIQPGFMFIAGTAMAYSLHRQQLNGMSWRTSFFKVLKRSGLLFFWNAVGPQGLSFGLWGVLAQLSFTTLIAFLIFRWSYIYQILFSLGILVLTEALYRFTNIPGFDQPFTDQHNFGSYVDLLLMNKLAVGGWVAINFIPTAAHTIWGALAGKILLYSESKNKALTWILACGLLALIVGYGLDFTITPIIKRISTSSFVLVSGGWCLLALSFSYWWIDVKAHRKYLTFFVVPGMNSLFIYLFISIIAPAWFNDYVVVITNDLLSRPWLPHSLMLVIASLAIFGLEWYMCWLLWRRRVFFKI